jgi:D-alanyl-D-alanine carboxypeptidase/D-alanyl-D-alanine-endopeptidase (penicillin-binding protein 4)
VGLARRSGAAFALVIALSAAVSPSGAAALDEPQLRRSLERAIATGHTRAASAVVRDLTTRKTLFAKKPAAPRIPASVEKLFTTATALRLYGPDARIVTRVMRSGEIIGRRLDGDLYIVGSGDPTLGRAAIRRLARAVRRAGITRISGSVRGDGSRFDALRGGPRTGGAYDPDMGGVLGALTVGRGFSRRSGGPDLAAARALVRALRAGGVKVLGRTRVGAAPAGARTVARSRSPRMSDLIRMTNAPSDNFIAETLAKMIGLANGGAGTTAAGMARASREMAALGLRPTLVDGSGLSRANRTSAADVAGLIEAMHGTRYAQQFEDSFAIAGLSGTLRRRLRGTFAAGACRGKTGTINRVSTLAGLCVTRQGHTVVFSLLFNEVAIWRAHLAQDRALRAIVSYRAR